MRCISINFILTLLLFFCSLLVSSCGLLTGDLNRIVGPSAPVGYHSLDPVNILHNGIETIVGRFWAISGPGETALQAQLNMPFGVAVDAAGNLYIADHSNHVIRKVAASTGLISTVAGTGNQGYAGDGGEAINSDLYVPNAVVVDASGNLYIADTGNNAIRKVTASNGNISTIAGNGIAGFRGDGGPAVNSELNSPSALALDSSGNLYIADTNNQVIRIVMAATNIISTVAGKNIQGYSGDGGLAVDSEISSPFGIAVDTSGNIYIADSGNNVIREVTAASGKISTIAGNGSYGYSGDGALAVNCELNGINGIALDAYGNLYIADTYNQVIRKVTASTGNISTFAGNGTQGYSGDGALAVNSELSSPIYMAVDSVGDLYISDNGNNIIRKVSASTGKISTYAGNINYGYAGDGAQAVNSVLNQPTSIAIDANGNLYLSDFSATVVRKVASVSGDISTVAGTGIAGYAGNGGLAVNGQLNAPLAVAVDADGNVYIADNNNNVIRKVTSATGDISTIAGTGTAGYTGDGALAVNSQLSGPAAIALDASGNLYIADSGNNVIRKITVSTGDISTVAGNGSFGYSGDGGLAVNAELSNPGGIAIDASDNLYIADTINSVIRKVTAATGNISTFAGNGTYGYRGDGTLAVNSELSFPQGIAIDALSNVYIADSSNNVIRKVTAATGNISTVAGNGTSGYAGDGALAVDSELYNPQGVAIDASGNLYIADSSNHIIRKVSP